MGDFYEMFHEDAKTAARVLNLALTSREKGENAMPMAGFPHHQLESYLGKLIAAGFRAAVCEQVEDPKLAKGLVRAGGDADRHARHGDRRRPAGPAREQFPGGRREWHWLGQWRAGGPGVGRALHRPVRRGRIAHPAVARPVGPARTGRVPGERNGRNAAARWHWLSRRVRR